MGNRTLRVLLFIMLAVILIAGGFAIGTWYCQGDKKPEAKPTEAKPTSTLETATPTTKVATPTAEITEALPTQSEEMGQEEAEAAIKAAMAEKYGKSQSEVEITVSDYQDGFAKGGVQFAGEMGGGWFLAAEVGGEWVIADDGNGTVACEKIEPYNFPVSMVSECWSDAEGKIIYR